MKKLSSVFTAFCCQSVYCVWVSLFFLPTSRVCFVSVQ